MNENLPAESIMKTGAPNSMPNCQPSFFFLLHCFLPKKVQPVGDL